MSNYNPPPDEGAPTRPMNPNPTNPQGPYQQPGPQQGYQQGYQPAPYQQNPYQQYPGAPPPPKKGGALKWVLIGCAGFLVIGIVVVGSLFYYGYNKAKQAGLDPGLMRRNPALAVAKIGMMNNPDVEFISVNEGSNSITVREKKTGKTVTFSVEQDKNGQVIIKGKDGDGKEVSMVVDGGKGSVDISSSEGNVKISGSGSGSTAKLPSWLPEYPGVDVEGTYAVDSNESSGAGYSFTTGDSPEEVAEFYENHLKGEGFKTSKTTTNVNGATSMSLTGYDTNYSRHAVIGINVVEGATKVSVVTQTKK